MIQYRRKEILTKRRVSDIDAQKSQRWKVLLWTDFLRPLPKLDSCRIFGEQKNTIVRFFFFVENNENETTNNRPATDRLPTDGRSVFDRPAIASQHVHFSILYRAEWWGRKEINGNERRVYKSRCTSLLRRRFFVRVKVRVCVCLCFCVIRST